MSGVERFMNNPRWQFWIDVGGTFTDCLATDPNGSEYFVKVLSSGIVKGSAIVSPEANAIADRGLKGSRNDFWKGATIRILGAVGDVVFESAVIRSEYLSGSIVFRAGLRPLDGAPINYELVPNLLAPVLGMHLLTATPIGQQLPTCEIQLGTTKGTNALLTRTGAKTAVVTSYGFKDFLTIGDQTRPDLFQLNIIKRLPLFTASIEIEERVLHDGRVELAPSVTRVRQQLVELKNAGIESIAVCLMHGYRYPDHERIVGKVAHQLGFRDVRLSSDVAPLIKLVPRGETTVLDAYLNPVIKDYLDRLESKIGSDSHLRLMTSAGSLTTRERYSGKDAILSGPAGGVVGTARIAQQTGFTNSISFDMGGTSTDVCRFDGEFELEYETDKAGVKIMAPVMAIQTVAAGGGSVCGFDGTRLTVGPESAGADPGPACYGRGGPLTVTDVNVLLGRIDRRHFPFPLDVSAAESRLESMRMATADSGFAFSAIELANGYLQIANHNMSAAVREISLAKGYDPRDYLLVAFGGAGGQHCCAVAENLEINQILVHPKCSVLSAYGIQLADQTASDVRPIMKPLSAGEIDQIEKWVSKTATELSKTLIAEGCEARSLVSNWSLDLRYSGTDSSITIVYSNEYDFANQFAKNHLRLYGYVQDRELEIVAARVMVTSRGKPLPASVDEHDERVVQATEFQQLFTGGVECRAGLHDWNKLDAGDAIHGPALISDASTTNIIDNGWKAVVLTQRQLLLQRTTRISTDNASKTASHNRPDPIELEIFHGSFRSIANQMGTVLRQTSISVNVKERLDFSCAIFSQSGDLVVNAPHIPVHLGAMSETVRATMRLNSEIRPGDVFLTNDPYEGGSHLPDVTVLTPIFHGSSDSPTMWVASRSHHAEIGGMAPGSMPAHATCLEQEGVLIQNFKLLDRGDERFTELRWLLDHAKYPSRNTNENIADITAQVAANQAGVNALSNLVSRHSLNTVIAYMQHIRKAAETKTRRALSRLADGDYRFEDGMDDGTAIRLAIRKLGDSLSIDFKGTDPVHAGNLNANRAIVTSAVIYVLRCLIDEDIPLNEGVLAAVEIRLPVCFLNPVRGLPPAHAPAVVGGNVETSQRIVDVLLGALGLASASQGTMNNWLIGDPTFGYYETVGGGSGATATGNGADAVHCHMSNTRLTDPEVLETRYPVVLREFRLRNNSGGKGKFVGGNGMIREFEFTKPLTLSILSSRRSTRPFGLCGGQVGSAGENILIRANGTTELLPSQCERDVASGDRLRLLTPGGGGFGNSS